MSGGLYGGDEVNALVFDCGHHSCRIGYAGEEFPKADIPSSIGWLEVDDDGGGGGGVEGAAAAAAAAADENRAPSSENRVGRRRRYLIDTNDLLLPRAAVQVGTFLRDGLVEDWDMFEAFLEYSYSHLKTQSKHHPVLMSEPAWTVKGKRERLTELMFEKFDAPAFMLYKNAVLTAYANGRSNALVLDSGASQTSATPVYDGYCLTQGSAKSPMAGDILTNECKRMLEDLNIDIVPPYQIAQKEPVEAPERPKWVKRQNLPDVTKSYQDFVNKSVVQDFQHAVLQVSATPFDAETTEKPPPTVYELPHGLSRDFSDERMRVAEGLFDASFLKTVTPEPVWTVTQVAYTSVNMCDIDIRPALLNNIVVSGGNSLIQGFTDRLHFEMQQRCPSGSFQQMWISKQEYDESGKGIVEKKCP